MAHNQHRLKVRACRNRPRAAAKPPSELLNPAERLAWQGFDRYRILGGPPMVKPSSSAMEAMNRVLKEKHRDLRSSCVFLSALAFCTTPEEVSIVQRCAWRPVSSFALHTKIKELARKLKKTVSIFALKEDEHGEFLERLTLQLMPDGRPAGHMNFLLMPPLEEGGCLHCLPSAIPSDRLLLPPLYKNAESIVNQYPSSSSSNSSLTQPTDQEAGSETTSTRRWVVKTPSEPGPAQQLTDAEKTRIRFYEFSAPLQYDGLYPITCDRPINWRCGWLAKFAGNRKKGWRYYTNKLVRPDLCSATLQYATRYSTSVLYTPVMESCKNDLGAVPIASNTFLIESQQVRCFGAGDVLSINGVKYSVVPHRTDYNLDVLKLSALGESLLDAGKATLRKVLPVVISATNKVELAHSKVGCVSSESLLKAQWVAVKAAARTPLATAVVAKLAMINAADVEAGDSPEAALKLAQELSALYPSASDQVAGRFAWGYCYSCGCELPQKVRLQGRICRSCSKRPAMGVARLIADGLPVASPSCPTVYPGVVNTPSRHPPLKPGVKTWAEEGVNFRLALGAWRQPYLPSPSSAQARGSVGSL